MHRKWILLRIRGSFRLRAVGVASTTRAGQQEWEG